MEEITDLTERLNALRRAVFELALIVETLADMVAASGLGAAKDLMSSETADDVATQMREHILVVKDALHQANRP
jgi:hypothetical protein